MRLMGGSWPGNGRGGLGSRAISFDERPIQGLRALARDLPEVRWKLSFELADSRRLVFIEQIAGADQVGRLLARQLEVVRAGAIAARELVRRERPPSGEIAAGIADRGDDSGRQRRRL